jgi:AcrR family transcriptional regulator
MTRLKSENKRAAILAAAIKIIAEQGLSAPTAKISKAAGIADGSLFTYFETKDDLLNQLYLELKFEGREEMMSAYPANASLEHRVRHVWDKYIDLGLAYPDKYKVLTQLSVSDRISEQTRRTSLEGYEALHVMMQECLMSGALREQSSAFGTALIFSLAEMTLMFIGQHPAEAERYRNAGFTALWNALTCA